LVQSARILTQTHRSAILDQWYTLPIFAWGTAWCLHKINGWNGVVTLAIEAFAVASYGAALRWKHGFEVALGIQIALIVYCALKVYRKFSSKEASWAFAKAIVCCAGFVGLKLLDHRLGAWSPCPFAYLSGHFWSKIADFMQIHYVCVFFRNCNGVNKFEKR